MKKSIFAGVAVLIISCSIGHAEESNWVECDIASDGTVSFEQSLESKEEQAQVSMVVYYPGKAFSDIENDSLMNVIAKSDQVMSWQEGKYKFEFKIKGESDFYTVEISSDKGDFESFKMLYQNSEDELYLMNYWNKEYITDEVKEDIFNKLEDMDFDGEEEFNEALLEQLVLETVKNADGYGNVRDILEDFESVTGIDTDNLGSTQYRNVLGNSYSDYEELEKDLKKKTITGGGGGSSNGGSGKKNNKTTASGNFSIPVNTVTPPVAIPVEKVYFKDLENYAWAKEAINALAESEIINGKGDMLYCPQDFVTREEFASILVKAFDIKKGEKEATFADVVSGAWYENNVKLAASAGIVTGKGDGSFGIGEKITRQDMAVMIARAKNLISENTTERFADDAEISDYAKMSVYAAKNAGIISGVGDNTFNPQGFATRAETAMVVYNAIK